MNVFRIHVNPEASAELLMRHDPVRGRKQLLECCQIIASAERLYRGETNMLKADGTPYGLTHPGHPCVRYCKTSHLQRCITIETAVALSRFNVSHACSKSLATWIHNPTSRLSQEDVALYAVVVRRNHEHVYVDTVDKYATLMLAYLRETKGFTG